MFVKLLLCGERPQAQRAEPPFDQWSEADGLVRASFYRLGADYLARFPEWADFEVAADGRVVHAWPAPGVPVSTLEHIYRNQVYPLALARQGKLVLHAGAVDAAGAALAFMGASGSGKSTLVASFTTAGLPFLTDDGLHLEPGPQGWQALPSEPTIRLWKDSRKALASSDAPLAPPLVYTSKRGLLSSDEFVYCNQARPLRHIYLLGANSDSLRIERIEPAQAVIELMQASFTLDLSDRSRLASYFDRLSALVDSPILYKLDYPRRYDELPRVREAILRHAAERQRHWREPGQAIPHVPREAALGG